MTTLDELKTTDLYGWMDELDRIMRQPGFNSMPFAERVGVRRMRTGLDYVASGLRMMQGGEFEPHSVQSIHGRRRHGS